MKQEFNLHYLDDLGSLFFALPAACKQQVALGPSQITSTSNLNSCNVMASDLTTSRIQLFLCSKSAMASKSL
jgi:hypothetical protein